MKSLTVSGYFWMKSLRNAKLSMIRSGYFADDTRMCPSVRVLARLSHGSQVTATSIFDATNAAPAAPDVMFVSLTSDRCRPFFSSTWARNHSETEPWLTPTVLPLRSATDWIEFAARMPSPPTEASIGKTSTAATPFDCWRANASTVDAMPSRRPAARAIKRSFGSSTSLKLTSRPCCLQMPLELAR